MNRDSTRFDVVLVGGGLQNALIAMALRTIRPNFRICLIERGEHLAGNHTWCFHGDDVPVEAREFVAPLVETTWAGYRVLFPRHERDLSSSYSMVSSERVHDVVTKVIEEWSGSQLCLGTEASSIEGHRVSLADGTTIHADLVVDSRGPGMARVDGSKTGYQKFVGLEVRTRGPHGVDKPIIMDALVEQLDGFRFLYVLPLSEDRLLLEDTRFSDTPTLDVDALVSCIHDYAKNRGYEIVEVVREEQGVLPLPWSSERPLPMGEGPMQGGFQGGWFHPVTGYSFPVALRLALHVACSEPDEWFGDSFQRLAKDHHRQLEFGHRLNGMLFKWFAPADRFNVLERFYKLPEPLIRRFYAMQTTSMDRARIFIGRPPRGMSYKAAVLGRSIS